MEQQILAGEAPDPTRIPSGCRFHPRCPLVESGEAERLGILDLCRGEDPLMLPACHAVAQATARRRRRDRMTDTLPYSWYTDPDVLARERARLFTSAWQYAGHTGELAEPGSYFTLQVGEVPLVVVRDREGDAARVRQRLPPPRRRGRHRPRQLHDAPVPLPRLDLRPRRQAAGGAALGGRPRVRQRRARPQARPGRYLGTARLRERRRLGAAARRDARGAARDRPRRRPRPRRARVPPARVVLARRQLEDRRRELPRVLPLRRRAPELQRGDRRAPGPLPARAPPDLRQPLREPARRLVQRQRPCRVGSST